MLSVLVGAGRKRCPPPRQQNILSDTIGGGDSNGDGDVGDGSVSGSISGGVS